MTNLETALNNLDQASEKHVPYDAAYAILSQLSNANDIQCAGLEQTIAAQLLEIVRLTNEVADGDNAIDILNALVTALEAEIDRLTALLVVPLPTSPTVSPGVLISHAELMARPTTGVAWTSVLNAANGSLGTPNISDQNSDSGRKFLACALAAVRLDDAALRSKAMAWLNAAIGTEENERWLAIGRTMPPVIAGADILDIRSGPIFDWIASFATRLLPHNNTGVPETIRQNAWSSGSNASSQVGLVCTMLARYTNDADLLTWNWDAYRRFVGDRTSPHKLENSDTTWQVINTPEGWVGIQNKGATINGINVDGAISSDMQRGGDVSATPGFTEYPWVGAVGFVNAAYVLQRAGYPAFEVVDQAVLRAATYLKNLGVGWYDTSTRKDAKYIINTRYNVNYPLTLPVGSSGLVGWADFWAN
jgi:hypothetical protein